MDGGVHMRKMDSIHSFSEGAWKLPHGAALSAMHCVCRASDLRRHEREPEFAVPVRVVNDFTGSNVNDCFDSRRFRM